MIGADTQGIIQNHGTMKVKANDLWVTDETVPDPVIKVLNEWVVVRPLSFTRKTTSNIIIPDTVADREEQLVTIGRVVAIGEYAGARPNVSKPVVGDYVIFPKHGGSRVTIKGVKVVFMYDDALMAVVDKNDLAPKV